MQHAMCGATPYHLSIIIPAYNEARRLPPTLEAIHTYLEAEGRLVTTEVIVADDGSRDETGALVARTMAHWPQLRVLLLPHSGKGAALRQGVLAARGAEIFLCDADLSMPIRELTRFLTPPYANVAIAIGSREVAGARRYGEPYSRHVMGRVFNRVVRWLAVSDIEDTQCGFKRLTRPVARDLFTHLTTNGFGFDVQLLALARLRGYTIAEVPIDWYYGAESRVRPIRDTIRMVGEVWQVHRQLRQWRAASVRTAVPRVASASTPRPLDSDGPAPVAPAFIREYHYDILD